MARLFKKDLQVPVEAIIKEMVPVLIVTAVLKGQTELLFQLCEQASKEIRKTNVQTRAEVFAQMITVFDRTGNNLRKQLAHIATTEMTPDDPLNRHIHNFVKYHAQGMGDPVYICTACGEERK